VGIALFVGERVMLSMVCDPRDHGALDRRRSDPRENPAQCGTGLEGAVGEQSVEPDRDPHRGDHVADGEDRQVAPVKGFVPDLPGGDGEEQERDRRHQPGDDAVGGLVRHRLDQLR
jgi:hypothetical protein